ncbi:transposase family protein [Streptomyces venezuelae]|uniref:transposase family protein n=1 Tax=Streptomyces venezuelae TaxID=54571 RepID=UPI0037BCF328
MLVDRCCRRVLTVMVLVVQADAPFWDSQVFDGIDDVEVEAVTAAFGTVEVMARGRAVGAVCPDCDRFSDRVHDRYQRRLKDLPLAEQGFVIRLTVRRFICGVGGLSPPDVSPCRSPDSPSRTPDPRFSTPQVLGVDDFAICRGQTYSTVLTSVEDHRVVDVLPTREARPLAACLTRYLAWRSSAGTGRAPMPRAPGAVPRMLCR